MGRVGAVFAAMGALLVVSAAAMYAAGLSAIRAERQLVKLRDAERSLLLVLSALKDAETGQRGFLLTGDEAYLEPYSAAIEQLRGELRSLDDLVNAGELRRADEAELVRLAEEKTAELGRSIALRRGPEIGGVSAMDAAIARVRSGDGKRTMDQIRSLIDRAVGEQDALLHDAEETAHRLSLVRSLVFGSLLGLNGLFMVWSYRRLSANARSLMDANSELARQRAWLSTTLTSIGDAVMTTDAQARVTFLNPTAERLTGWSLDEAMSRPLDEIFRIVNEDTRVEVESPVVKAIREGVVVGLANHTVLVARDGREYPIDDSAAPIRDSENRIVGVVLVFHDISDRKAAELQLRERDQRFADFVRQVRDYAIFSTDPQGRPTTWNEGVRRILGYGPQEFIGLDLKSALFTPEDRLTGAFERELSGAAAHGASSDDRWLCRKDGSRFFASGMTTAVRDQTGAIAGFTKVFRDLTERQRFEREREALLANEQAARVEAEAANRSKDLFLATLSHEMRTPLNAIVGWISLLRRDDRTPDDLREGLEAIDRNAHAQAQLIEDVLDVSRIVTGNLRLEPVRCNLSEIIAAALRTVRPAAEAKDLRITTELDESLDGMRCDPARIQQVVWNLLSNAVKFTPKGGAISLWLGRDHSMACLRVADSGVGITADFLPFVFDRFRQADSTSRRRAGGLGLGLSIVKQLVELHGGTVEAASEGPGRGSTFTVRLPIVAVTPEPSSPAAQPAAPPVRLEGIRVVVVDDEADARRIVARVLSAAGASVTAAASVREALFAIDEIHPHVLVSDIAMPEEDGHDLIRQVRARGQTVQLLPAVALTAFAGKGYAQSALLAGFQVHVAKPIDPQELLTVVGSLAGRTGSR